MKRSKEVRLTLLTTLALLAGACDETHSGDEPEVKHCVDQNDVVVDDDKCNAPPPQQPAVPLDGGTQPATPTTPVHVYRWYYGGGTVITPGNKAAGGGFSPSVGKSYVTPRGGFGSTGMGGVGG